MRIKSRNDRKASISTGRTLRGSQIRLFRFYADREKDLRLALVRIQKGRSRKGESKLTISAVAREAEVSTALIHNYYPAIAEQIREIQGRSSPVTRELKHQSLVNERRKNKILREEIVELRMKVKRLASLNEVLIEDKRILQHKLAELISKSGVVRKI